MDFFLDTALEPLLMVLLLLVGVTAVRDLFATLARRRRIRELAESRNWRFLGYLPGDGGDPYTRFEQVSSAVLLRNVVEGREQGFDFSIFEYRLNKYRWEAAVLVQLEVAPLACHAQVLRPDLRSNRGLEEVRARIGPQTVAALQQVYESLLGPMVLDGLAVNFGSGALLMRGAHVPLDSDQIPALLEAGLRLAKAVVEDERVASEARMRARRAPSG